MRRKGIYSAALERTGHPLTLVDSEGRQRDCLRVENQEPGLAIDTTVGISAENDSKAFASPRPDPIQSDAAKRGAAEPISSGPGAQKPMVLGYLVIAVFILVVFVWAATVPLSSAAIAAGTVVVDGYRKAVQHLEGGIVAEILIANGDSVKADQVLILLDDTQPRIALQRLQTQHIATAALAARLRAESTELDITEIALSDEIRTDPLASWVEETLATQREIFRHRQALVHEQRANFESRLKQLDLERSSRLKELEVLDRQQRLYDKEMTLYRGYLKKGLVTRPKLFELEEKRFELSERRGVLATAVASVEEQISEQKGRLIEWRLNQQSKIATDWQNAKEQLLDIEQRIAAARDSLQRTAIRAPIDGTVVNMTVLGQRGVIEPGQLLLEIVPAGGRLVIDAKLDPKDRDRVAVGQPAEVRFSAFNRRSTRPVPGVVSVIAADSVVDPDTTQTVYQTLIELDGDTLDGAIGDAIFPGMHAEVLITTGDRTPLSYLLEPLRQNFNRALREE